MIHVHFPRQEIVTSLAVFLQCYIFVGLSIVQSTRLHTTYISILFHNKIAHITAQTIVIRSLIIRFRQRSIAIFELEKFTFTDFVFSYYKDYYSYYND